MSSSVVSVDAGVLLPVLAPAAGAAAVLVLDVVATRLRRSHYVLALVSVIVNTSPRRRTRPQRPVRTPA